MYYHINEETASRAKQAYSFYDYIPGSATAEYRAAVDRAAQLVQDRKDATSPFYHEKLDSLLDAYARRLADWTNRHNANTASCPSVMICGGSNFPVRKKEKQNAREDRLMEEYREISGILDKIRHIGEGGIDFADPTAREQLSARVNQLQESLDQAKAMNAHYRKHHSMAGFPGISDESAAKMDASISSAVSWCQKPAPDYELTSLRGKLKRAKERLEEYDRLHAEPPAETPADHFELDDTAGRIVRNVEENRLQIHFQDIPSADIRHKLKSYGFRWSPKNQAWQRQLTQNAEQDAKRILGID